MEYFKSMAELAWSNAPESCCWRLKFDEGTNTNKISFTTTEIFASKDGDQVLEIGYYSVVDSTNTAINTGNYMSLFEKRDGQYVCLRDMSTSDMPLD